MKDWVVEVLEQSAVASILGRSGSPTIRRLSLIICDNAFEFAMKAFVEFDSDIIGRTMSFSEWERNHKPNFERVVTLVLAKRPNAFDKGSIMRYHGTRSDLYHEAKPLTVDEKTCLAYVEALRKAVQSLFSVTVDENLVIDYETKAVAAIAPQKATETGPFVESRLDGPETDSRAICRTIWTFQQRFGREPSRKEVIESLRRSGHPVEDRVFNARVSELRRNRYMSELGYGLRAKGRKIGQSVRLVQANLASRP